VCRLNYNTNISTVLCAVVKSKKFPRNFLKGLLCKPFKKFLGFDEASIGCSLILILTGHGGIHLGTTISSFWLGN
jgi:hypothetical protein